MTEQTQDRIPFAQVMVEMVERSPMASLINRIELVGRGATEEHAKFLDESGTELFTDILKLIGEKADAAPEDLGLASLLYYAEHVFVSVKHISMALEAEVLAEKVRRGIPIAEPLSDDPNCQCENCVMVRAAREAQERLGTVKRG